MILKHWTFDCLELDPLSPYVIAVENPKMFFNFSMDFHRQLNGEKGEVAIIKGADVLPFSEIGGLIYDYAGFSLNEKRLTTAILKSMKREMTLHAEEIRENLYECWKIISEISQGETVPIEVQMPAPADALKIFSPSVEEPETLTEKILLYMDALSEYCGMKVMVFQNLKSVTDGEEREQIYQHAAYRDISLVLLESRAGEPEPRERTILFDKDMCLVYNKNTLTIE